MSSTNRGSVRHPSDYYATPPHAIDALLWRFPRDYWANLAVCDAGAGDGRIGLALGASRLTMVDTEPQRDDVERIDFLGISKRHRFYEWDAIIGNPPYRLALEFARKAFVLAPEVHFLLRINFLGSKKRVSFWREHPVDALTVITPRPSFTNGGTDSCEYAWFHWGVDVVHPIVVYESQAER